MKHSLNWDKATKIKLAANCKVRYNHPRSDHIPVQFGWVPLCTQLLAALEQACAHQRHSTFVTGVREERFLSPKQLNYFELLRGRYLKKNLASETSI